MEGALLDSPDRGFFVQVLGEDGEIRVRVGGEIDMRSAQAVRQALVGAGSAGSTLMLDLEDVRFMDVAGLNALLGARPEAAGAGSGGLVVPPKAYGGRRIFELVDFAGLPPHLERRRPARKF